MQPGPDCRRFGAEVAGYLDGDSGTSVEAHATHCSGCRSLLEDLKFVRDMASQLPLESPSAQLWTRLRDALQAEGLVRERRQPWRSWLGQLGLPSRWAMVGAAAALAALALIFISSPQRRKPQLDVNESPGRASVAGNYAAEEASLERTVSQMEQDYRTQASSMDPAVRGDYQKGLESLNNSIKECSETLRKAPENSLARQYLMEAYAQKATILASALEFQGR